MQYCVGLLIKKNHMHRILLVGLSRAEHKRETERFKIFKQSFKGSKIFKQSSSLRKIYLRVAPNGI